jgi:tetratricopeptide (TPR) repeat protein
MRMKWIMPAVVAGCVAVGAVSGCQEQGKKQTIKEKAEAQWNQARGTVLVSLAQDQYKAGNFDKARQTIDDAAKLMPKAPAVLVLSAKIAIEQGQLERADRELATARTAAPNDAEAFYLSGVVCQRWQKQQEAFAYYQQASEKAPSELAYLMAVSETLVSMDRSDEALALLQGKIIFFENSSGIRDAAARLLMTKKQYKQAADLFRQATILTPDEQSYREGLGLALYYSKQYKDAVDVLTALVKLDAYAERADLRFALGESQLQVGKSREARENLEVAGRLQPGNAGVWLALARAAMESNDLKRAEASIRKGIALAPNSAEANLLLGYLRLRQERLHDALSAFTKSSTLDRSDNVSICMIGYVFERLGRKDAAAKCYAKALKMKPSDQMASQLMAGLNLND